MRERIGYKLIRVNNPIVCESYSAFYLSFTPANSFNDDNEAVNNSTL